MNLKLDVIVDEVKGRPIDHLVEALMKQVRAEAEPWKNFIFIPELGMYVEFGKKDDKAEMAVFNVDTEVDVFLKSDKRVLLIQGRLGQVPVLPRADRQDAEGRAAEVCERHPSVY